MSFERRNVTANGVLSVDLDIAGIGQRRRTRESSVATPPANWLNRAVHRPASEQSRRQSCARPLRQHYPRECQSQKARVPGVEPRHPTPVPSRQGRPIHYANVCTITGPATAVAGPVSRGARFCSIHASPRLLDSSAPA